MESLAHMAGIRATQNFPCMDSSYLGDTRWCYRCVNNPARQTTPTPMEVSALRTAIPTMTAPPSTARATRLAEPSVRCAEGFYTPYFQTFTFDDRAALKDHRTTKKVTTTTRR